MKDRKIYTYFIQKNMKSMMVVIMVYMVASIVLNALMGKDTHSSVPAMSIIMVFIFTSFNKDDNFMRYSCFSASRNLMYRIQIINDFVLAAVMGVLFMIFSLIATYDFGTLWFLQVVRHENGFTGFGGAEFGILYFVIVLCIEAIITFDAFRREPIFEGMFNSKKATHPVIGFIVYMVIAMVAAMVVSVLEEQTSLTVRCAIYAATFLVSIGLYAGAKALSTKKEF